eukprot:TRINITY_DN7123_c2_g1_i1.p1 TRINITY_DN7123_c2_g1~~TRINITY_DN7123_c2_g1_i1.p1  ORF type:complete len:594 (+),score=259.91 TRINITY_DN7123_c2_g1_i1:82-1782(+)
MAARRSAPADGAAALAAVALGAAEWLVRAGAAPAPPTPDKYSEAAPPAPEGPSTLHEMLTAILACVGLCLICGLVALLVYVISLKQRLDKEAKEDRQKDEKVTALLEERDKEEQKLMTQLAEKMQQVESNFDHAHNVHAKFIKDHNPERFEEMRKNREIRVEGDSEDDSHSSMSTGEWLEQQDINPDELDDQELNQYSMQRAVERRGRELDREIRQMQKARDQKRKEFALEEERLKLEQRLVDLEHQEKSDELKRLERKQREQEALDNVRGSTLFIFGPGGEVVRGRNHMTDAELAPYESDEDLPDDPPDVPDHLDDLSPRGRLLKKRLQELRERLATDKAANKQRQNEMERDMSLMRLRLQQQKRRQEKESRRAERERAERQQAVAQDGVVRTFGTDAQEFRPGRRPQAAAQQQQQPPADDDRATDAGSPPKHKVSVGSAGEHHFDVPTHEHHGVPHFITAPWAVESGAAAQPPRGRRAGRGAAGRGARDSVAPPSRAGKGRDASKHLLQYVAEAVKDEAAHRDALAEASESRASAESPLRSGLPPAALPSEAIPPSVRDKRLML